MLTYEARQVCAIKPPGLRPDGISRQLVSLSPDTLALTMGSSVRCFDTAQGRPLGEALSHSVQVKAVALSQVRFGGGSGREFCMQRSACCEQLKPSQPPATVEPLSRHS